MPAAITIRDAAVGDVDGIVRLVESAYRGQSSRAGWTTEADLLDGGRTDAAEVAGMLAAPDSVMLLATDEAGTVLGCCHLQRRDERRAHFGMFAVRPALQGAGIGRRLLVAAEDRARRAWGSAVMEMTVLGQRADLIAWYLRRGYSATGETTPWPYRSATFGIPRRDDLYFATLAKPLPPVGGGSVGG